METSARPSTIRFGPRRAISTSYSRAAWRHAQIDLRHRIDETLRGAILAILCFGILGILFIGWGRRMLSRIDRERQIIETLQRAFRTGWDPLPRSRIGTAYISATRDASVGGDLFDIRRLGRDRGLLVVADVSGKGIEAAVNTAFVKYSLRTLALANDDPAEILGAFNRHVPRDDQGPVAVRGRVRRHLDARTLRLTYASAGHAGAFFAATAPCALLEVTGPIVGLDPAFAYETRTLDSDAARSAGPRDRRPDRGARPQRQRAR